MIIEYIGKIEIIYRKRYNCYIRLYIYVKINIVSSKINILSNIKNNYIK